MLHDQEQLYHYYHVYLSHLVQYYDCNVSLIIRHRCTLNDDMPISNVKRGTTPEDGRQIVSRMLRMTARMCWLRSLATKALVPHCARWNLVLYSPHLSKYMSLKILPHLPSEYGNSSLVFPSRSWTTIVLVHLEEASA